MRVLRQPVPVIGVLLLAACLSNVANAQLSGSPSRLCHVTDGKFTTCPGGGTEWSDVQPLAFPASQSFLYVNQDAAHNFLYLTRHSRNQRGYRV
jgi:hypothetical protein